jgi:hypothetical protein
MEVMREMWLGGIFGPFLLIMGFWMLLHKERLAKVQSSLKSTPACFHLLGVLQLLVGLTIVGTCRGCMMLPGLLISLLGWVLILRGILSLFFPNFIIKTLSFGRWVGVIPLVWGLLLCWFAFV